MYEQSMTSANEILALNDNATGDKYINNNSINYTTGGTNSDIAFSKKAIHQCDADENLFLRFLELDPLFIENTTGTDTQSNNSASKKQQLPANKSGRTPFTITKKLLKSQDNGFGFSIVWTHPPRIEKVESQLSAEKSGILPGDYVIFIDKYNIVTMPELDILNLIRTQGNTLILEIFRRPTTKQMGNSKVNLTPRLITTAATNRQQSFDDEQQNLQSHSTLIKPLAPWSSSAMSNTSLETTKRRLRLPTVPAISNQSLTTQNQTPDSLRKRYLIQLINREQHFVSAINFGVERFVLQMKERKDLISANDHRTMYQNIDELLQLSEDILEQLLQNDHDPQIHFASRVYLSKTTAICAAYKKYCNGLKRADCVLVNKSRTSNSDFMTFINEPPIPKKRPDITTFIHRPLQHFREILKLIQMIQTNCPNDSDESKNFTNVINELQAAYREITVGGGLMEPIGEGRPLLSLQDLESRLVFTKCKPFTLSIPGRQWIFGGDLSRIDGRSVKQFWTLLFSDIILFAKVSRDRVLFITDEPLPLSNVVDCCFNIRKKNTEFRLTIDPNGRTLESPTVHCTPDLTRTPLKSAKRRNIILRAPSTELKAVWQNLLTRQIFIMNTTLGSSLNSPLESPDILYSQVGDINLMAHSMASIKMSSMESINNQRNQQNQHKTISSSNNNNNNSNSSSKMNKKIDPEPKITKQLEELIDEKCNLLSKSGVSKEGTVHLAQWMKGQFNKQVCASEPIESDEDNSQMQDWSIEEVRKRSTELHLLNDTTTGGAAKSKQEDFLNLSEVEDELKSGASNTTSDSQITVRSSPINNNNSRSDSISVCRQCHKFCKKKRPSTPNDNNNNQLKLSPKREDLTSSESSTIVDDNTFSSKDSSLKEEIAKDMRTSATMATINDNNVVSQPTLKTSTSSPSRLQHHQKPTTTPRMGMRVNFDTKSQSSNRKSISSLSSICNCECKPKDFEKTTLSPDEVKHEIVKILNDVEDIAIKSSKESSSKSSDSPYQHYNDIRARTMSSRYSFLNNNNHMSATQNNHVNMIKETLIGSRDDDDVVSIETKRKEVMVNGTNSSENDDDLSLMLIDLAQIKPVTSSLPTISILPPTPDPIHSSLKQQYFNATKDLEITKVNSISIKTESSFDSIDEEDEEPPYMALKTSLRRSLKFGTMSSLERLPSEDTDEKTLNSSEEESDGDLKVVTREVYDNTQTFRTWTSRAGTFLEESRAFIDKYLGRTENGGPELNGKTGNDYDEYETIEGETSGATSGEEVWGTPTSGGENDEIHMFSNADGNRSSPTKSSSSYTGDEDTEIMMDELLMAPIMTSSNIRGLLPRRRLEPLFEEDTDSCDSNNESCLLTNDKQGERIGKSIERCQSLRTSIDSDSPKTTPSASLNGEQEEEQQQLNMMSPTTLMAQQDLLSPVEDLDLDEDVEVKHLESNETQKTTTPVEGTCGNVADKCSVSALLSMTERKSAPNHIDLFEAATAATAAHRQHQMRLSPRLEMRLALNHNIMGDEDLMMYEPGPNLTSILGRDLSTYHRVSGKDIIMNRIMNRKDGNGSSTNNLNTTTTTTTSINNNNSQTHELNSNNLNGKSDPLNSFYQQNNSKMDTPILNRKLSQRTWSSSGFARKEEKALSDLERLARREKIYCMTQQHQNSDSDSTISNQTVVPNKKNKLLRLLSRRNSESIFSKKITKDTNYHSGDETASQHSDRTVTAASTKENDKTMYRRWTKQLSKRRRSTSLSENSS